MVDIFQLKNHKLNFLIKSKIKSLLNKFLRLNELIIFLRENFFTLEYLTAGS